MKNTSTLKTVSGFIALGTLLAASAMAQRPFDAGGPGTPPDPATMVANQVARLTALLTLTTAQASQATTIFTNAQTAIGPLQTTLRTDRTALHTAVQSNSTSTIDSLATSIGTLTSQILAIQSKAEAAFYAILTADQKTKLDAAGGRGGFGGGPGGPGGFGGPPPGRRP
jgi:Spy/CpxP family protein refolding chaperone